MRPPIWRDHSGGISDILGREVKKQQNLMFAAIRRAVLLAHAAGAGDLGTFQGFFVGPMISLLAGAVSFVRDILWQIFSIRWTTFGCFPRRSCAA